MGFWSSVGGKLVGHALAWRKESAQSPVAIRIYAACSLLAAVTYFVYGDGPGTGFVTLALNLLIVATVMSGSFTGWGLSLVLALVSVIYGATGVTGGPLLMAFGGVIVILLSTRSARQWVGAYENGYR
jgi:hypothetical protein